MVGPCDSQDDFPSTLHGAALSFSTGIALTALAGADGVASEISITVCACATTSPVCRVVNPTRIRVHLGIEMRVHDVRFEALHANVHHVQGSTQRWDVLLASSSVP